MIIGLHRLPRQTVFSRYDPPTSCNRYNVMSIDGSYTASTGSCLLLENLYSQTVVECPNCLIIYHTHIDLITWIPIMNIIIFRIRDTILNCIYVQKKYWNCFNYQPTYSTTGPPNVCDGVKQKHTVTLRWEGDETRADSFATRDCYPLQDSETKRRIRERLNHLSIGKAHQGLFHNCAKTNPKFWTLKICNFVILYDPRINFLNENLFFFNLCLIRQAYKVHGYGRDTVVSRPGHGTYLCG